MNQGDLTTLAEVKSWLSIATANDDVQLGRMVTAISQRIQSILNRSFFVTTQTERRNGTGTSMMILKNYPVISVSSLTIDGTAIPLSPDGLQAGYMTDSMGIYLIGYTFTMAQQNVVVVYNSGYRDTDTFTIPTTPYQISTSTLQYPWNADGGVTLNGVTMTAITSGTPVTGQYLVSAVSGTMTYTFAAADAGKTAVITYSYTPYDIEQAVIELIGYQYRAKTRIGENSKSIGGEVVSFSTKDMPATVQAVLDNYKRVTSFY